MSIDIRESGLVAHPLFLYPMYEIVEFWTDFSLIRTCPDCGCCEEANRVSQDVFTCQKCGLKFQVYVFCKRYFFIVC